MADVSFPAPLHPHPVSTSSPPPAKIGMTHYYSFTYLCYYTCHAAYFTFGNADTTPALHELQTLQRNNKLINIIESIASHWEEVAIALSIRIERIRIIKCDSHGVEEACRRMLEWWLDSERDDATWRKLIRAVEYSRSDFLVLAHDIEKAIE